MTIRPAYSPAAPEFGWKEIAAKPVISHKSFSRSFIIANNLQPGQQEQMDVYYRTQASLKKASLLQH